MNKWLSLGLLAILGIFTFTGHSYAHDWYSYTCCGGQDCHPVACEELTELANGGYKYLGFTFDPSMVHPSQDAHCHVCISPDYGSGAIPHCVYIQTSS